jgi:lipoprotein-anchoring transpeptidase ErfK/SrfK
LKFENAPLRGAALEDDMTLATSIRRGLARIAVTAALTTAFLAAGYSNHYASATLPPPGEGLVLVPPAKPAAPAPDFVRGKIVSFATRYAPGSVVVVTKARRLYYVLGGGKAVAYKVATAKRGFEWKGVHKVSAKVKWPNWSPPAEMRQRRPDLPEFMAGGPDNPLGARALYLGSSLYRIHGTNEPSSIGKAASSGCIRMLNQDVTELYAHVKRGALVVVM